MCLHPVPERSVHIKGPFAQRTCLEGGASRSRWICRWAFLFALISLSSFPSLWLSSVSTVRSNKYTRNERERERECVCICGCERVLRKLAASGKKFFAFLTRSIAERACASTWNKFHLSGRGVVCSFFWFLSVHRTPIHHYVCVVRTPYGNLFCLCSTGEEVRPWYIRLKGCCVKIRWICRFHSPAHSPVSPFDSDTFSKA